MNRALFILMVITILAIGQVAEAVSFEPGMVVNTIPGLAIADEALARSAEAALSEAPAAGSSSLSIAYPYDQSIFPADIIAPKVEWRDADKSHRHWLVALKFAGGKGSLRVLTASPSWTPAPDLWEAIKRDSREQFVDITVVGMADIQAPKDVARHTVAIKTSKDAVEAPIFFRDVPLPFIYAYHNMDQIKWRLGDVSSASPPRVVLENMSVCGNCHSFSNDGTVMGMDVDYANDKGAYVVASVSEEIVFDKDKVISWTDFRKQDGEATFGLLARLSPDGRYVVSTLKDMSVFVPVDDLCISQLFFPFKGILVVYDVASKTYQALPGADDRRFVHSSATWSPDGKTIVFARTTMNDRIFEKSRGNMKSVLSTKQIEEFVREGEVFRYDLYKIPFNNGKGGAPEPLAGAGGNGRSNFFPKYSPDGKWIVFTQANSYMLLQPDSELHIVPAAGGEARRMNCNRIRMNSWHSFSPNGRWLVFSSKANTPYTQLFLTHIDENGMDAPPVLLANFTESNRAANIPEFVNIPRDGIKKIKEAYIDEYSHLRMAEDYFENSKLFKKAEREALKAIEKNPTSVEGFGMLGRIYEVTGDLPKAKEAFEKAILLNPQHPGAYGHMAVFFEKQQEWEKAKPYYLKAMDLEPKNIMISSQYAQFLTQMGDIAGAKAVLQKAVTMDPENPATKGQLALFLEQTGDANEAIKYMEEAVKSHNNSEEILNALAGMYVRRNQLDKAEEVYKQSLKVAGLKAKPLMYLGALYEQMNKPEQAEESYRGAIKDDPTNVEAYFFLSEFLQRKGILPEARELLEKSVKVDPGYTETHVRLGKFLIDQQKFADAEEVLLKALMKASQTSRINRILGTFYLGQGDEEKGERHLRQAVEADPFDAETQFRLGSYYFGKGVADQAEMHLASSTRIDSAQPQAFMELGKLYAQQKKYDKAETAFTAGLKNASAPTELYTLLGALYAEQNQVEKAKRVFDDLLGKKPDTPEGLFRAAQILARFPEGFPAAVKLQEAGLAMTPGSASQTVKLGDYCWGAKDAENALLWYEKALSLDPTNSTLSQRIEDIRTHRKIKQLVMASGLVWLVLLGIYFVWGRRTSPPVGATPPSGEAKGQ